MELAAQHGQHVHASHWLAVEQYRNIIAVYFETHGFLEGNRRGLMRRLLEHGGESDNFASGGLGRYPFLLVPLPTGNPPRGRAQHVSLSAGTANLPDALRRAELFVLHLSSQYGRF